MSKLERVRSAYGVSAAVGFYLYAALAPGNNWEEFTSGRISVLFLWHHVPAATVAFLLWRLVARWAGPLPPPPWDEK